MIDLVYISQEKEEAILSKFLPIELFGRSPRIRNDLCVFWSKEEEEEGEEEEEEATTSGLTIQSHIKTFLCSFRSCLNADVLIQFWAATATMMGGRRLLTTSHQPFAFTNIYDDSKDHYIYENLIRYRKHCVGYTIRDGDGVIGRVFHNQLPELNPYVRHYSLEDHPLRDIALSCGIPQIWAFPVFQPSQQSLSCVGVLEFLFHKITMFSITFFDRLYRDLELAGLVTIHTPIIWKQMWEGINHVVEDEIKDALRQVCQAHGLSPASAVVGDMRDKLFVEIDKFSIASVFESLKTRPTIISEIESGALQNEVEVMQANFPGHHFAMEEFANGGGIGGDSDGLKQRGKAITPENNCLKKKSIIDSEEKRLEKNSNAHNQKESSCSYETLKQHFGRKLEDAAESLGVSRSTVKRWCRENNTSRWPFPKRSKVIALPPIPRQIKEPIKGNVKPISDASGKGPSSSDVPTDLAPKQAMDTMTVKVTYMNDLIKFQLSFSSRRIDLMEKVTVRLKLSEGTFTIKYLDEDGDYILILCDEDLQDCINSFRMLEKTAIKMLIEPLVIILTE